VIFLSAGLKVRPFEGLWAGSIWRDLKLAFEPLFAAGSFFLSLGFYDSIIKGAKAALHIAGAKWLYLRNYAGCTPWSTTE
jgi:hypothetical protein